MHRTAPTQKDGCKSVGPRKALEALMLLTDAVFQAKVFWLKAAAE
jgi:hypothetical protein